MIIEYTDSQIELPYCIMGDKGFVGAERYKTIATAENAAADYCLQTGKPYYVLRFYSKMEKVSKPVICTMYS